MRLRLLLSVPADNRDDGLVWWHPATNAKWKATLQVGEYEPADIEPGSGLRWMELRWTDVPIVEDSSVKGS